MPTLRRNKKPNVVILGAGLAGLTAAYVLKKKRYEVIVLEAKSKVGGRVDTRTLATDPPLTVEMGGEWIGIEHKHIRRLCRELGLKLVDHRLKTALLYDGHYLKPGEWRFGKRWRKKLRRLVRGAAHLSSEDVQQLDAIDWWHYLVSNHVSKRDREIIDLIDSTDYGEDIRFVSAYNAILERVAAEDDASACSLRIKGGNTMLPERLASSIGRQNIKLNREVVAIHQRDGRVVVECKDDKEFVADKVICTLPASVLPSIAWYPRLPEEQLRAFAALDYSRIIKISILFKERFWPEHFELATDTIADFIYHTTQGQPGDEGVLTAYAVGDRAYVLSNLSDQDKAKAICSTLELAFGNVQDKVEQVMSYYWTDDEFAGGAYALFEKNSPLDLKVLFRQRHGNIYFAGEHTANAQGFMEGAVESGLRAAEAVHSKL